MQEEITKENYKDVLEGFLRKKEKNY